MGNIGSNNYLILCFLRPIQEIGHYRIVYCKTPYEPTCEVGVIRGAMWTAYKSSPVAGIGVIPFFDACTEVH